MIRRFGLFGTRLLQRFYAADGAAVAGAGDTTVVAETPTGDEGADNSEQAFLAALNLPPEEVVQAKGTGTQEPAKAKEPEPGKTAGKPNEDEADEHGVPKEHAELPHIRKMRSRIDKLTAQRELAREEANELREKLAKAGEGKAAGGGSQESVSSDDPFAGIETHEQLTGLLASADKTLTWAEAMEDRFADEGLTEIEVSDGKGGTMKLTAKDVKAYRRRADKILREQHTAANRIADRAQYGEKAKARFPFLGKAEDERTEAETATATLAGNLAAKWPELKRYPDATYLFHLFAEAILGDAPKAKESGAKATDGKAVETKAPEKKAVLAPPPPLGAGGGGGGLMKSAPAGAGADGDAVSDDDILVGGESALADMFRKDAGVAA